MNSTGTFEATAPTNIALLKYWGKDDPQLQWPSNDSISMTLNSLNTRTRSLPTASEGDCTISFNGKIITRNSPGGEKIFDHLERLAKLGPFKEKLEITTANSFPVGCGIASSASGMAALTLSALGAWLRAGSFAELEANDFPRERLEHLARLGSGSACRSFQGGLVHWVRGATATEQHCDQLSSPEDWSLADVVVVVDGSEKEVPSSRGHLLAPTSPLFSTRLAGMQEKVEHLKTAIANKDFSTLGRCIESEALEMHAIMMTSQPSISYFGTTTTRVLDWVRRKRLQGELDAYFTLDAGPNVHLICERQKLDDVVQLLRTELSDLNLLIDEIGAGAKIEHL